ncbi:hypothetical protein NL676_000836 [Syzygium grande]|nr:hypothetical protein NL676_000836 [Syzygium grande]
MSGGDADGGGCIEVSCIGSGIGGGGGGRGNTMSRFGAGGVGEDIMLKANEFHSEMENKDMISVDGSLLK